MVSVVVPTRDRGARLVALLRSLGEQTAPPDSFEVVIVDDGSVDETPQLLAEAAEGFEFELTTLTSTRAGGPAAARNRGWRSASAGLIAFVDDDCIAAPDWVEVGMREAAANPGAVIQGLTLPDPAELDLLGPLARTREIRPPTLWFETCNIFYERAMLERLGGFDQRFGEALGEDTDLGWRALEHGATLLSIPEALVYHAVDVVGVRGMLREARRGADAVYAFKRHPRLRRQGTFGRIFWRGTHAVAVLAAFGAALTPRHRVAALLTAPYAADLVRRARARRGGTLFIPLLALCDLLEISTAVRGSIRHRILII